ncbi:MAG: TRAP transporter substrate-binding protein [Gammaproteobacteria bacterium]|nr:TRAP transporter substrate-binding protein [Gammaproteobacteria bacterium]
MKRRDFIKGVGAGSVATAGMVGGINSASAAKTIKWKMVTSWPKNFPGLGTGANFLAKTINEMSGGRLKVKVYGANEIVPALEVFDAVSRGTAQMGHSGAYYWKGKHPATQFFTSVPFGLTAQEMNGWLYHGGGMQLWEELYDKFNLIPNAAGNTGVQMGGWFNKEINSVDDLKGLKMRIPGLGGEVLKQAGGTPVTLPGGEIYTSMQSGAIDATEWVGPYNDMAFGLYKVAKFYYHPGWHEPGSTMEAMINKDAFNELPEDLQIIVRAACRVANQDMLADYTAKNNQALQTLISKHKVEMRQYPDDVIKKLHALSNDVVAKVGEHDALSKKIHQSFVEFKNNVIQWSRVSEQGYMKARALS